MQETIKKVGIVGAGTMGQGIAQTIASEGYSVVLYDIDQSVLQSAVGKITRNLDKGIEKGKVSETAKHQALSSITVTDQISEVTGELIVEAVIEDLSIKIELFLKLESVNGPETIFATNTSSIPITRIGSALKHPQRLAGLHFFNPAHIMKLVEVISGSETQPDIIDRLMIFSKNIRKVPVRVMDSPGFIVNRVARHYYVESLKILEECVTDHKTVDELLESYGFKMGPFKLMDLIGVDTNFAVTKSIFESFHFDPKFRPSRIQQQKVDAGHHGRKSGQGFYKYE